MTKYKFETVTIVVAAMALVSCQKTSAEPTYEDRSAWSVYVTPNGCVVNARIFKDANGRDAAFVAVAKSDNSLPCSASVSFRE